MGHYVTLIGYCLTVGITRVCSSAGNVGLALWYSRPRQEDPYTRIHSTAGEVGCLGSWSHCLPLWTSHHKYGVLDVEGEYSTSLPHLALEFHPSSVSQASTAQTFPICALHPRHLADNKDLREMVDGLGVAHL